RVAEALLTHQRRAHVRDDGDQIVVFERGGLHQRHTTPGAIELTDVQVGMVWTAAAAGAKNPRANRERLEIVFADRTHTPNATLSGVMPRALFVTIGQSPRSDLLPEIREWLGGRIDIEERGALDGLGAGDIATMAPGAADHRLVTRLADGYEVVLRKDLVHARLQTVFDAVAAENFLCTVLLCTGHFPPFRIRGLFLEAQSIVDESVGAIARHARSIGLMVPLKE